MTVFAEKILSTMTALHIKGNFERGKTPSGSQIDMVYEVNSDLGSLG